MYNNDKKKRILNISYSFGMVDLIHFGHINAMKNASIGADLNIFGLLSDEAADSWFGIHVSNVQERRAALEGVKYIDEIWIQNSIDPINNLRILHAKYPEAIVTLYTSSEWTIISAKEYIESIGGKVVKLNYYDKLSSQSIVDKLNTRELNNYTISNKIISTKANTLQTLKHILSKSRIEDIFILTVGEYKKDCTFYISQISNKFVHSKVVVRSSSKSEDSFEKSNAGHFTSILNVDVDNPLNIKKAISDVIVSYGNNANDDEQVLIQKQTEDVLISGVVFTRDIQRNRPYYVINYDETGSTDKVTSGSGGETVWISRSVAKNKVPQKWKRLMDAVWELEEVLSNIILDIEFAITSDSVVIFQVRPLAAAYKFGRKNNDVYIEELKEKIVNKYNKYETYGLTCFSDMAFWNPAEIIGDNPRNLDFSLYKEIITSSSWNIGLLPLGYRLVPGDLMYRFGNKPYINIEKSFEALMPATISESFVRKLLPYYINSFKNDLSSHDKIEFEISHNCFDFSLNKRLKRLIDDGFEVDEIFEFENSLKLITKNVVGNYDELLKTDLDSLNKLNCIRIGVQNKNDGGLDFQSIAKSIFILLEAIKKLGTPQFSRHARCAFIAKSLCKSLVSENYISARDLNQFLSQIQTVATNYDLDYRSVLNEKMSKNDFFERYGHLRAGTYNIRSPRYDQMDNLFVNDRNNEFLNNSSIVDLDIKIYKAIEMALSDYSITDLAFEEVISFIKKSIAQREYFKFEFTKTLSYVIELIKRIGNIIGIEVKDLSYIELPEIYSAKYYSDTDHLYDFWKQIIDKRKELYKFNSEIILPSVICSEQSFYYIENINSRPNYITDSIIKGEVVVIDDINSKSLKGKIVVIEKADPGYDWIFTKGIVGLVTKYGGAASHMAIRCAEFQIPAAIGCGTNFFNLVIKSKKIMIDCKHEKIIRIE